MLLEENDFALLNGDHVIIRSPGEGDAAAMVEYLKQTSAETEYLSRYPEEVETSPEEIVREAEFLKSMANSPCNMMIAAFLGNKVIGNISLNCVGERIKLRHRGSIGIAVLKEYWGLGLGHKLMEEAIQSAGMLGFELLELGVMDGNDNAIKLYLNMGFQEYGRMHDAFRMKDGRYVDEILMSLHIGRT